MHKRVWADHKSQAREVIQGDDETARLLLGQAKEPEEITGTNAFTTIRFVCDLGNGARWLLQSQLQMQFVLFCHAVSHMWLHSMHATLHTSRHACSTHERLGPLMYELPTLG